MWHTWLLINEILNTLLMFASFIITFRETLEAALIAGIILSYLNRTNQTKFNNVVYVGIAAGVVVSVVCAFVLQKVAGGLSGRAEEIFEGTTMFVGAFLLTSMILWMMRQKQVATRLREKVTEMVSQTWKFGLFMLVFVAILREGIETVIFLSAAETIASGSIIVSSFGGIIAAIALGYLMFVYSMKINIKRFFTVTSVLLIFFAAGLIAHGMHEFHEAGLIPPIVKEVWNINPAVYEDGSYPWFHDKGYVGGTLKELFGYNGNPSLMEVSSYMAYLLLVAFLWRNIEREQKVARNR